MSTLMNQTYFKWSEFDVNVERILLNVLVSMNESEVRKYLFFGKYFKKTSEYFLKFLFLFEITMLPVNNGK